VYVRANNTAGSDARSAEGSTSHTPSVQVHASDFIISEAKDAPQRRKGDTAIDNKHEMELDEGCVTGAGEGRSDEDLATEGYVRSEEESDGDVSTEEEEGEGGVEDDDVDESQSACLLLGNPCMSLSLPILSRQATLP
jgi:hypothetical protein